MSTQIKALPFFGGTLSGFDPSDTGAVESTAAGTYDSAKATCSLSLGPSSTIFSPTWPAASTFWVRYFMSVGIPVSGSPIFTTVAGFQSGTNFMEMDFQWEGLGTGWQVRLTTQQGGNRVQVGAFSWYPSALNVFDVQIVAGASGVASLYSNNTLAFTASGLNHTGFTGIDQIKFSSPPTGAGGPIYYSEVICDTTSTVGRRLRYDRNNTNSAVNTGWTGSVTNINEIPTSDATPLTAAASNLTSTFFENGLNLGNVTVLARGVSARMKREDASGPQHIALVIRAGSTNFASTNIPASLGYAAAFNSWTTNPHTGVAFTSTNASSIENGVKSLT